MNICKKEKCQIEKAAKKVILLISVLLIFQTIYFDLFQHIRTEEVVVAYQDSDKEGRIVPGTTQSYEFDAENTAFSSLEIFFESENKKSIKIALQNENTGEIYINREILDTDITTNEKSGKNVVKIFASGTDVSGSLFPGGG